MKGKRMQDLVHARELIRTAYKLVSDVADKERDDFENMSWKRQTSAKGEREEEDIFTLEEIRDNLKENFKMIEEVLEERHDEV